MKKLLLFLALLITQFSYAQFQSDMILTSKDGLWTDARAYSTLNAAIAAAGANERTVVIPSIQYIDSLTIPSNITLEFLRNGAIANTGQLTINTKNIIAPNRRIFSGIGDIDFASGTIVKSGWFFDIESALVLTSDDTITLIVSKPQTITGSYSPGNNVILKWEAPGNIITVDPGVTIANIKSIESGDYQILAGAGTFTFVDGINLNLRWFNSLRSAITWISSTKATLKIPPSYVVDLSDTIGINTTLDFNSLRGSLSINAGVAITCNSQILSDLHQIFSGSGTITISSMDKVYPQWWGAKGDGVFDNYAPIYNAIYSISSAKSSVYFSTGTYLVSSVSAYIFPAHSGLELIGDGDVTIKFAAGVSVSSLIGSAGALQDIKIKNIKFDGSLNANSTAIDLLNATNVYIDKCHFISLLRGINIGYPVELAKNVHITNSTFSNITTNNIRVGGTQGVWIQDNWMYESGLSAIDSNFPALAADENYVVISGNYIQSSTIPSGYSLVSLAGPRYKVYGNEVDGGYIGIVVHLGPVAWANANYNIFGNIIRNSSIGCWISEDVNRIVSFHNNIIELYSQYGVLVYDEAPVSSVRGIVSIQDNIFYDTTTSPFTDALRPAAIFLTNSENVKIGHNSIYNPSYAGIMALGNMLNIDIESNTIIGHRGLASSTSPNNFGGAIYLSTEGYATVMQGIKIDSNTISNYQTSAVLAGGDLNYGGGINLLYPFEATITNNKLKTGGARGINLYGVSTYILQVKGNSGLAWTDQFIEADAWTGIDFQGNTPEFHQLYTTSTWTPGLIASGASVEKVVALVGARLGIDWVIVSPGVYLAGCSVSAYVASDDNIRIQILNNTGAPQTIGAGNWKILLRRNLN